MLHGVKILDGDGVCRHQTVHFLSVSVFQSICRRASVRHRLGPAYPTQSVEVAHICAADSTSGPQQFRPKRQMRTVIPCSCAPLLARAPLGPVDFAKRQAATVLNICEPVQLIVGVVQQLAPVATAHAVRTTGPSARPPVETRSTHPIRSRTHHASCRRQVRGVHSRPSIVLLTAANVVFRWSAVSPTNPCSRLNLLGRHHAHAVVRVSELSASASQSLAWRCPNRLPPSTQLFDEAVVPVVFPFLGGCKIHS